MAYHDLTGEVFGRLTLVSQDAPINGRIVWFCRCACGNKKSIMEYNIVAGKTLSCGCIQREATAASNGLRASHGHSSGVDETGKRIISPEYSSWRSMIGRCYLPCMSSYPSYGGRGITVCDEWRGKGGFLKFLNHVGPRPYGKTLDRIDSNGNYEPGNVRWATPKEQSSNRRPLNAKAKAAQKATLDAGRAKMWFDPEIRARLIAERSSRRKIKGKIVHIE